MRQLLVGAALVAAEPSCASAAADGAVGASAEGTRAELAIAWDEPASARMAANGRTLRLEFDRPVGGGVERALVTLRPWITSLKLDGGPSRLEVVLRRGVRAKLRPGASGRIVLALERPPAEATPSLAEVVPQAGPAAEGAATSSGRATIRWRRPVPSCVFQRGGEFWAVFGAGRSELIGDPATIGGPWRVRGLVERQDLLAIRLQGGEAPAPVARRSGNDWLLEPVPSSEPPRPIMLPAGSGKLILPVDGREVSLADPDSGETVHLVLSDTPSPGWSAGRSLVDIRLLPASAGMAWRVLSDGVTTARRGAMLEVSRPGGMRTAGSPAGGPGVPSLAQATTQAARPGPAEPASTVDRGAHPAEVGPGPAPEPLGLASLPGPVEFRARREELRRVVAGSRLETAPEARIELARLYIADGLGAEAQAVLRGIQPSDVATRRSRLSLLLAAAAWLQGRVAEAATLIEEAPRANDEEASLWRAVLAGSANLWPEAVRELDGAGQIWRRYPPRLRSRLGLAAATILVRAGRTEAASSTLNELTKSSLDEDTEARAGILKLLNNQEQEKHELIHSPINMESDAVSQITASFIKLTGYNCNQDQYDEDHLEKLRQQRMLWRGHPDEAFMLTCLAKLETNSQSIRNLLLAVSRYMKIKKIEKMDETMQQILEAFLKNKILRGDFLNPIEILAAYKNFHLESLPSSESYTAVENRLADLGLFIDQKTPSNGKSGSW